MSSPVLKRSVAFSGRKTSVSLEEEFWSALKEISARRGISASDLIAEIDRGRAGANLSSSLRIFVLKSLRARTDMIGRKRKVLVVDDELSTLEVTAGMLEELGCEVVTAVDGNEALAKLDGISMLITDINMPGLNGHELAERARRMRPGLPVVLVSGQYNDGYGLPLLRKPLREADLARVLQQEPAVGATHRP